MQCKCGCGGETNLSTRNDERYGSVKGQPLDFINGHQNIGRFKFSREEAKRRNKEANKTWRENNKEKLSNDAKKKYNEDEEFRTKMNEASRAASAKRRAEDPEKEKLQNRAGKLEKRGWTIESVTLAKESQEGRCAICGVVPVGKPYKSRWGTTLVNEPLNADHTHTVPPKPRALLCTNCNTGLGQFKDSPELLEKAADYLRKWN